VRPRADCRSQNTHGSSFKRLYDWLTGRDLLLIKADHKEVLIVVPLRPAVEIIELAIPHLQESRS
jgi:hypothetical protein